MLSDRRFAARLPLALALGVGVACGSASDVQRPPPMPDDLIESIKDRPSCALACDPACEKDGVWTCPALAPWDKLSHAPECGAFDGKTFPPVTPGKCFATDPTADALAKTQANGKPVVLPDGRRVQPWGKEHLFDDFTGGFPASLMRIPGTRFVAVTDTGYETHSIRIVDGAALRSGSGLPVVVSSVAYPPPRSLQYGLAYKADTKTLYAAGGTPDSRVYAYVLDDASGAIAADPAKDVALPAGAIAGGIGISPDGKTLLVGQATETAILMYSLEPVAYGKNVGAIDVGRKDVFALAFDPNDATGKTAYATLWTQAVSFAVPDVMQLVRVDTGAQSSSVIPVGKSPEEIAFLDDKYVVVANALSDSLSVVDRAAGTVVLEQKIGTSHGPSPTALAYDSARKRLYATLASENSVAAFDVDLAGPKLTLAGRVPTSWWPTSVAVDPSDGGLFVLSGRGHGIGTDGQPHVLNEGTNASLRLAGSIQGFDYPDATTLATTTPIVEAQNRVSQMAGYSTVQCNGAPYDFPVPATPDDGASTKIKHVFFIVRENKTFDGLMGNVPGVNGDPRFVLSPNRMDIFANAQAIAKTFTQLDNYYIDAEQSIQGHAWTVFGRSTDYTERRWINIWGRHMFSATSSPGVAEDTTPQELNIFQFLKTNGVGVEAGAELIGGLAVRDPEWPGGTTESVIPDTLGACYMAWRTRVKCTPNDFTYSWLPNDHTFGLAANMPNPAIMVAVNDEATGMYIDGISHSPFWPSSLIIVIEDDPSDGGDHVDYHRTIALFASPWVKRGYVSHAHYDLASLHKLISAVYGKPYRNTILENAPLPLDVFTSTPDYTPFDYVKRTYADTSCNGGGTVGAMQAAKWDFTEPDDQPGLDAHVWAHLHSLPPR
jgi:DNA-binding beta-propeller fold protein YncE